VTGQPRLPLERLLLFVIFFVFLELGFGVAEQFFEHLTLRGIGRDFEHFPIVLNILPRDKAFHNHLQRGHLATLTLELDQCGHAETSRRWFYGKDYFRIGLGTNRHGSNE
jgi:hypothetical protein